jgi:hypothetical protein
MRAIPVTPDQRRPTTWLAFTLFVIALAMVGFMAVNRFVPGTETLNGPDLPLDKLIALAITVSVYLSVIGVGALPSIRRPDNPVGWLPLVGGICSSYADFSLEYVGRSIELDEDLPGYRLVDYSGEQLVSGFGERLRDQVDLQRIRAEIPATIDLAVRPRHLGHWLCSGGEGVDG